MLLTKLLFDVIIPLVKGFDGKSNRTKGKPEKGAYAGSSFAVPFCEDHSRAADELHEDAQSLAVFLALRDWILSVS